MERRVNNEDFLAWMQRNFLQTSQDGRSFRTIDGNTSRVLEQFRPEVENKNCRTFEQSQGTVKKNEQGTATKWNRELASFTDFSQAKGKGKGKFWLEERERIGFP